MAAEAYLAGLGTHRHYFVRNCDLHLATPFTVFPLHLIERADIVITVLSQIALRRSDRTV
jgi:hypothetical protein